MNSITIDDINTELRNYPYNGLTNARLENYEDLIKSACSEIEELENELEDNGEGLSVESERLLDAKIQELSVSIYGKIND